MQVLAASSLRLDLDLFDYLILALYFITVLGIGFAARRAIHTSADFFLSGRSMPAWVTGLAFVSANLGAVRDVIDSELNAGAARLGGRSAKRVPTGCSIRSPRSGWKLAIKGVAPVSQIKCNQIGCIIVVA